MGGIKHWSDVSPHLHPRSDFLHLCSRFQGCLGNSLVGRVKAVKLRPPLLLGPAVWGRKWVGKRVLSTMRTVQACRPPSAASGGPSASRSKSACVQVCDYVNKWINMAHDKTSHGQINLLLSIFGCQYHLWPVVGLTCKHQDIKLMGVVLLPGWYVKKRGVTDCLGKMRVSVVVYIRVNACSLWQEIHSHYAALRRELNNKGLSQCRIEGGGANQHTS